MLTKAQSQLIYWPDYSCTYQLTRKEVKDKIWRYGYSLRTFYRYARGKVKHKHIANLPKCTDDEIKALRLGLTFKAKLEDIR